MTTTPAARLADPLQPPLRAAVTTAQHMLPGFGDDPLCDNCACFT